MSNSSDPGWGGQQPDDRSREGQPDGGAAAPRPGEQPPPGHYQQYQPGQYPQQGPYGPPPGQYQPPAHGLPYGERGGYVYSPYGSQPGTPYPAGLSDTSTEPLPRPGTMILALVLLILSTLPFLAIGVLAFLLPSDLSELPPNNGLEEQLAQFGVTYAELISVFRLVAAVVLPVAVLYVVFAALAFRGHGWARIVLTIMTVGFTLTLLYGTFAGPAGADPASLVFLLLVLGASVTGTVLLYTPDATRYITSRRR